MPALPSCGDLSRHSGRRLFVGYLLCQIKQSQFQSFVISTRGENDTDRIVWLGLDAISRVTWLIYRSHHSESQPRYELSYRGKFLQPVELEIIPTEKIITYKIPQSNLPDVNDTSVVVSRH